MPKNKSIKLTQKKLKEVLYYDSDTGIFTWNKDIGKKIKRNDIAGYENERGYISICFNKKGYRANRLAWFYMEGYWPEYLIDHINRIKNDNRWKNLRHLNHQCNLRNQKVSKNNKSGVTGVRYRESKKKWEVCIIVNKEYIYLGGYKSFTKAVHARWKAECKYNWANCNTTSSAYLYLKNKGLIK